VIRHAAQAAELGLLPPILGVWLGEAAGFLNGIQEAAGISLSAPSRSSKLFG
jgi:hypothetical protein